MAQAGKVTTVWGVRLSKLLRLQKNRFIENSLAHPRGRPSCLTIWCFRQERAEDPAGHSVPERGGAQDPDSLVSDSGGRGAVEAAAEETAGSQQSLGGGGGAGLRSPGLVGEGSWSQGSLDGGGVPRAGGQGRGGGAIRWPVGLSLRLRQQQDDVTRQLWAQLRRLCHPPRRPSIRQCLSGPFGGARRTAGPHAWGQRQRVRGPASVAQDSSHIPERSRGKRGT